MLKIIGPIAGVTIAFVLVVAVFALVQIWDVVLWASVWGVKLALVGFGAALLIGLLAVLGLAITWHRGRTLNIEEREAEIALKRRELYAPVVGKAEDQIFFPYVDQAGNVQALRALHNPWLPVINGGGESIPQIAADAWAAHNKLHATVKHPSIKIGEINIGGDVNIQNNTLPDLLRFEELPTRPTITALQFGLAELKDGIRPFELSLREMEHLLISAKTRWGKSNFAAALLTQVIDAREPVTVLPVDRQNHGLALLNGHPAVVGRRVRITPDDIADGLRWLRAEADRRRQLLATQPDAADIWDYNDLTGDTLEPILVVVDEAASLLDDKGLNKQFGIGDELRRGVWEFGKFGIFQILLLTATNADVIPTGHRHQFTTRLSFNGGSRNPQHYVTGCTGEMLDDLVNGPKGRAIIEAAPLPEPVFIQTPFIERRTVRERLASGSAPAVIPGQTLPIMPDGLSELEQNIFTAIVGNPGASYNEIAGKVGRSKSTHTNGLINEVIQKCGLDSYEIGMKSA